MRAIGWCALWAIYACLNPLPEEFPSNEDLQTPPAVPGPESPTAVTPGADDGATPQDPSAGEPAINEEEPPASGNEGSEGDGAGRGEPLDPDAGVDAGAADSRAAADAAAPQDLE